MGKKLLLIPFNFHHEPSQFPDPLPHSQSDDYPLSYGKRGLECQQEQQEAEFPIEGGAGANTVLWRSFPLESLLERVGTIPPPNSKVNRKLWEGSMANIHL